MAVLVEYEGREWVFETPTPALALSVRKLQDVSGMALAQALQDLLMDWMLLDDWVDFFTDLRNGRLPDDALPELFMRWLEEATGKPFSAVGALSSVAVRSWNVVRGRLVMAGIPDPARQLRTLAALLDAVDVMIREGHKNEKETAKYEREVYRPRQKHGAIEKPAGFERDDMAAQAALLAAYED